MKRIPCILPSILILFLSGCSNSVATPPAPPVQETLTVDFKGGTHGVMTANTYSGPIAMKVEGVGQASGSEWSDAFYIYTDSHENAVQPWHPRELYNWSLWINDQPVDAFLSIIPPYSADHIYVFVIDAPGGQLIFGVGDTSMDDNSGSYTISILQ